LRRRLCQHHSLHIHLTDDLVILNHLAVQTLCDLG
jgi:hypothetical protein